jgi:hypothetical protein
MATKEKAAEQTTEQKAAEQTTEQKAPTRRVVNRVTRQQIKIKPGKKYTLLFEDAMYIGKPIKGDEKKEPPHLANVKDMDTGEIGLIICPHVLRSELNNSYPDAGYVGKYFEITQHKVEGKNYTVFDIAEVVFE